MSNRRSLARALASAMACSLVALAALAQDPQAVHGMLVVGEEPAFLLHLPMFQDPEALERVPPRRMPHRYQAILEVAFAGANANAHEEYVQDRRENPDVTVYSIAPEPFVLPELAADEPRTSFPADVFRGHFEKGGEPILRGAEVRINRVVHFREFDPEAEKPERLEYLLFGRGDQLFAAHVLIGPPDFDHVLSVRNVDREFSDDELAGGVRLVFPQTTNSPRDRLKANETARATVSAGPATAESEPFDVEMGEEIYFEEGELMLPAIFETTSAEEAAGFP